MRKMYEYDGVLYNMNVFVKFVKDNLNPEYSPLPYLVNAHTSFDSHDIVKAFKFKTEAERDEFWKWLQD